MDRTKVGSIITSHGLWWFRPSQHTGQHQPCHRSSHHRRNLHRLRAPRLTHARHTVFSKSPKRCPRQTWKLNDPKLGVFVSQRFLSSSAFSQFSQRPFPHGITGRTRSPACDPNAATQISLAPNRKLSHIITPVTTRHSMATCRS